MTTHDLIAPILLTQQTWICLKARVGQCWYDGIPEYDEIGYEMVGEIVLYHDCGQNYITKEFNAS